MNQCNCMNYVNQVVDLFDKDQTQVAAIILAVAAFVLGMVAMCLVCKILCPCGKKSCKKDGKKQQKQKKGEEKPFEKRKPHPAPADGSVEIYVGNLSYDMTEDQLRKEFEAYGKVGLARLITNRYNGKSKGFGFVQMPNRDEAEKAVAALNDKEVQGRKIKCNEAKNLI